MPWSAIPERLRHWRSRSSVPNSSSRAIASSRSAARSSSSPLAGWRCRMRNRSGSLRGRGSSSGRDAGAPVPTLRSTGDSTSRWCLAVDPRTRQAASADGKVDRFTRAIGCRSAGLGDDGASPATSTHAHDTLTEPAVVRVFAGPDDDRFRSDAFDALQSAPYVIAADSDRMGFRLQGPELRHAAGADIISDATPAGSVQVPGSGQPILLMADRPTTGGYPRIATVISADLGIAGQRAPGDTVLFRVSSASRRAVSAHRTRERAPCPRGGVVMNDFARRLENRVRQ